MKLNKIPRVLPGTATIVAMLGLATASFGQVTNGSFETGTFSGWTTLGDTFITTGAIGTNPTDGTDQALLATATDGTGGYAAGTGTSSSATMESFLGLSSGSIAGVGNGSLVLGSAIKQSFTMLAGQTLTFNWDFLTNQTYNDGTSDSVAPLASNDDFSFVSLTEGGSQTVAKLADVFDGYKVDSGSAGGFDTAFKITPASNPFISETGYKTFTFTATETGTYTLGIGVVHASTGGEDGVNSGLLVDNAQVAPEPASLFGLSALCIGIGRKVRNRSKRV